MKVNEEYLRWCFNHCDKNNDDQLTEDELDYVAWLAGSLHTQQEKRKFMMGKIDKNGDGHISFEEFRCFMEGQPDPRQALFKAFNVWDDSGDGYISKLELSEILCGDKEIDRNLVTETLDKFDRDGDGRLNIAEYIDMMMDTLQDQCGS